MKRLNVFVSLVLLGAAACGGSSAPPSDTSGSAPSSLTSAAAKDETLPPAVSPYDTLSEGSKSLLGEAFTGDFDAMVKRRVIRAGVAVNRTHYFIDKGVQRGIAYDSLTLFEDELNKRLNTGLLKVHIAIVPLARDQLFPALTSGRVDLLAATLTITPDRQKLAAFSNPTRANVNEIVVTSADAPPVKTTDDLSGREVFVRKTSSYYESLQTLSSSFASRKMAPVVIREAPETLEDDDILEMVNSGLIDVTVVDNYMAEFWQKVFTNMRLSREAAVRTGGMLAVAVRKDNPKLLQVANAFIKKYGPDSAFGKMVDRRYMQSTKYVTNAVSAAERKRFQDILTFFRKYGDKYGVDAVMMAAQGYQESRLDQSARSQVGAIGVMQVMPDTGKELAVGDITQTEANIHAGVKYMKFMMNEYFKDEPIDDVNKMLMSFAAYNCGPGRLRQLRRETGKRGLNPNVWFGNVEQITSERIGRETVTYVSNIYKYYVAYKLVVEQRQAKAKG
jgi:membrane-bound lytic murein transglycosylase MltF